MDKELAKNFASKFQAKTKSELVDIISNARNYQPEALYAAKWVIEKEKYQEDRTSTGAESEVASDLNSEQIEDFGIISSIVRKFRIYTDVYGFGDFISLLANVLTLSAFWSLLDYYEGEKWLEDYHRNLRVILFAISYLSIHYIFKREHGFSNNFLGRYMHTTQYLLLVFGVRFLYKGFQTLDFSFSSDYPEPLFTLVLAIIISISLLELSVGLLKWIVEKIFKVSPI